jgi:hypothetical protein
MPACSSSPHLRHHKGPMNMNAITFGKGVPVFGKNAAGGFGRKGDMPSGNGEASKQDGALDVARTVLEAATDLRDEATAEVCRRVIEASLNGRQPSTSDLLIISRYFQ